MMKLTHAEENYLKSIYMLSEEKEALVPTNTIATFLKTSAASVTDMVQKLYGKGWVVYQKYQGVNLTEQGKVLAIKVLRKHLLWEVFLVDKLKFGWNAIHEIAEQLEHIDSDLLIERLAYFLGYPSCSPHGVPIPNANGEIFPKTSLLLTEVAEGTTHIVSAIKDDSPAFLQYLGKRNIHLGTRITVIEKIAFDASMDIDLDKLYKINISHKVADRILVTLLKDLYLVND